MDSLLAADAELNAAAQKRNPWVSLREALDEDENGNLAYAKEEFDVDADPRVVHDEDFYNRLQHAASHK